MVQQGPLRAGPFDATRLPTTKPKVMKIWLGSVRDGKEDAILTVKNPSGHNDTVTRPGGAASAEGFAQFWPGTIPVSDPGPYEIEIVTGRDHMCLIVDYNSTE